MGVGIGSLEAHSSRALPLRTSMSGNALVTVVHARSSARRLGKTQAGMGGCILIWDGWLGTERVGEVVGGVWVADQSEAGFAEAQLAAYGIRRFEKACGMSFICVGGVRGCECAGLCRTEISLAG